MRSESHSNTRLLIRRPTFPLHSVIEGARASAVVAGWSASAEDLSVIYSRRREYNLLAPTTVIDTCMQHTHKTEIAKHSSGESELYSVALFFDRARTACVPTGVRLKVRPAGSKSSSVLHIILSRI
jgi:hypothetical protein